MDKRTLKDNIYKILAGMVKAMANKHRLEIIDLLSQAERSVEEIAVETGISVANASQHLQVLKQSNLVQIRRTGNFINYRLANEEVYKAWYNFRALGLERNPAVRRIMGDYRAKKKSTEPVRLDELLLRVESPKIVLLDVRPEHEFHAGHIPNSLNIPIHTLPYRLNELNKTKEYIAYCRGIFCVFADDAVELLVSKGYKASRLDEGYPDWKIAFQSKLAV